MGGIGPEQEARLRVLFDKWHGDAPSPDRVYEIMRELFDKWHIEAHQDTDHDPRTSEEPEVPATARSRTRGQG